MVESSVGPASGVAGGCAGGEVVESSLGRASGVAGGSLGVTEIQKNVANYV